MSKQRIRRKGPDGRDLILDVDLGPGKAAGSVTTGALTMGNMQPILTGSSHGLARRPPISVEIAYAVTPLPTRANLPSS